MKLKYVVVDKSLWEVCHDLWVNQRGHIYQEFGTLGYAENPSLYEIRLKSPAHDKDGNAVYEGDTLVNIENGNKYKLMRHEKKQALYLQNEFWESYVCDLYFDEVTREHMVIYKGITK